MPDRRVTAAGQEQGSMKRRAVRRASARKGFSALLAIMFMGMFATLAVGFYAATNTAVQVSSNDQQSTFAQTASESGMDFMRFQLAQVKIPPGTPANLIMSTLYAQLAANMNGTRNMG